MSATTSTAIEWYAVALAAVHHYRLTNVEDLAAHLRVTRAEWAAIDRAWTAVLVAPGTLVDLVTVARFVALFAQTRKRLMDGGGPTLVDLPAHLRLLRPIPEEIAPKGEETLLPVASAEGPVLPFVAALRASAAAAPRDASQAEEPEGFGTAMLDAFVPGPALPFATCDGGVDEPRDRGSASNSC